MKPRPITGLKPGATLGWNAERIMRVRIDEVFSFEQHIADPARVRELHDMRIAFKRLRYLLEIFAVALPRAEGILDEIKVLQELLGDIHDRDVQVPLLEAHLRRLDAESDAATRTLVASPPARADESDDAIASFAAELGDRRRDDERLGIERLIVRLRRERQEIYARFLAEWAAHRAAGFRVRLERAATR